MRAGGTVPAMTTPHDTPPQFGHPSTWPAQPLAVDAPAPQRPRRAGLIAAAVAGVVVLMAATGVTVWLLTRPDAAPTPAAAAPGSSAATLNPVTVAGELVLQRGQFAWQSAADPTCWGLNGFSDLAAGAQVTVTDAGGKVLVVGSLQRGVAEGIATDGRATTCSLRFELGGVPGGVGPYGVEVAHRGVVRFNEGELVASVTLHV